MPSRFLFLNTHNFMLFISKAGRTSGVKNIVPLSEMFLTHDMHHKTQGSYKLFKKKKKKPTLLKTLRNVLINTRFKKTSSLKKMIYKILSSHNLILVSR